MRFKRFNRLSALAAGLCLAAAVAAAAAPAWAAGASPDSPDPYALEAPAPGAALLAGARTGDTGSCGKTEADHLTWTLTQETDGWWTLTISGSGAMADYRDGTTPWSGTSGSIKTLVLPEGLTSIGNDAFYGCRALASANIPEGVKTIGNRAFYNCKALPSAAIPEGVETIGDYAFYECNLLKELTIPESVTSIGEWAFGICTSLPSVTIPGGVKTIENYTFYNCKSLTELVLPEGVTSIGDNAFCGCSGLTAVTLPASLKTIGNCAFYECSGLTEELTLPEGVETIGSEAFCGCTGLTAVSLPDSLKIIGNCAFYECSGLTGELALPGSLETLEDSAFYGCSGLAAVSLPDSLMSIGDGAFNGCESLETVVYTGTERLADLCESGLEGAGFGEGLTFRYAAAIQDGGTGASGGGVYTPGDSVTLRAGTREHHTFAGWTVSGVTLTEAQLKTNPLTFPMPDGPVTASANWALPSADSVSQTGSTVKLTFPGAAPADGARVLAALDGTAALSGTYDADGSEVTFQKPLESGRRLFFLDPDTLIPLAMPAILE